MGLFILPAGKIRNRRQFMKKTVFFSLLVLVLAFGFISCGGEEEVAPVVVTFEGEANGETFVLKITDGSSYELTVGKKTSTGAASVKDDVWTLTPSNGDAFTVTVSSTGITSIVGIITFTDGSTEQAPGAVEPKMDPIPSKWLGNYIGIVTGSDDHELTGFTFEISADKGVYKFNGTVEKTFNNLNVQGGGKVEGYNASWIYLYSSGTKLGILMDDSEEGEIGCLLGKKQIEDVIEYFSGMGWNVPYNANGIPEDIPNFDGGKE